MSVMVFGNGPESPCSGQVRAARENDPCRAEAPMAVSLTGAGGPGSGVGWANFRGLVLGCIDASDSESWLIFQHFSRSTRFAFLCIAQILRFQ